MNITDVLDHWARVRPDHPFLETPGTTLSFAEFRAMVDRTGALLLEREIRRGDIVVLMVPSDIRLAVLLVALPRIGAVYHSLEPGLPPHELEVATRDMEVAAFIAEAPVAHPGARVISPDDLVRRVPHEQVATIPSVRAEVDGDAPAMFLRSSGTTGKPKHVLFTHAESRWKNIHRPGILGVGPDDRALVVPALTFNAGRQRLSEMLEAGGTMVLFPAGKSRSLVEVLRTWRITYVYVTPVHVRKLLADLPSGGPHLAGTRFFVSAAHLTAREFAEARERVSPSMHNFYAANEFGAVSLASPQEVIDRPVTVGRAVIGVSIHILDEMDRELPPGTVGRVALRGQQHPRSFHKDPELTARCFRGGMNHPGDIGHMDADGYLFLHGRHDEVINSQGSKFYPSEVEEILLQYPGIREASVFGAPVDRLGEAAIAYLVTPDGNVNIQHLRHFLRERLSPHKMPAYFFATGELPRNPTGKVLVGELRRRFEAEMKKTARKPPEEPEPDAGWRGRYPIHEILLPEGSFFPDPGAIVEAADPPLFSPPFPAPRTEAEARSLFLWINGHQLFFMSLDAAATATRRATSAVSGGDFLEARRWIERLLALRRGHVAFSATAANIPREIYESYVREAMRSMRADFSGVSSVDNWVFDRAMQELRAALASPAIVEAPRVPDLRSALRKYQEIDRLWWIEHTRIIEALVSSPTSLAREEFERQQAAGSSRSYEEFRHILRTDRALEENDRFFAVRRAPVNLAQMRRNFEHILEIMHPHRDQSPAMVGHWEAAVPVMREILAGE